LLGKQVARNLRDGRHATAMPAISIVVLCNFGFIGAEYVLPVTGPFSRLYWR